MTDPFTIARRQNIILIVISVLWQGYILFHSSRYLRDFETMTDDLAVAYPAVTRWFLAAMPYLWGLPVISAIAFLLAFFLDKKGWNTFYMGINSVMLGMGLHVWANEAFFAPLLELLRPIE